MSAPDFKTVYQFETAIETAVKNLLAANGLASVQQRGAANLTTPRAAVLLQVGRANGQMFKAPGWNNTRPAQWNGSLQISIATNRTRNDSSHDVYRGTIRDLLYNWRTNFTAANLPYHQFVDCFESGTTAATDAGNNEDVSSILFEITFGIRPDAWPTI